jgi:radical SAM protein (TIGR01212 family)
MKNKPLFLKDYLKNIFGERVQRVPLDPDFNCPNRQRGKPCIYCDPNGSAAHWIKKGMDLDTQMKLGKDFALRRYGARKYIAYFQAYTTTNADADSLRKCYDLVLSYPGVVGMAISTRPDCISDDVFKVLQEYSGRTFMWVELGAQSMNDKSLEWMDRGHDSRTFSEAVKRFVSSGIDVVGHIIFGLPCETFDQTLESFRAFIASGISGYKVHALHVIKGTPLADMYLKGELELMEMDEYIELVRRAVEMTPANMVIHRLTGEAPAEKLLAPDWVLNKSELLRRILE